MELYGNTNILKYTDVIIIIYRGPKSTSFIVEITRIFQLNVFQSMKTELNIVFQALT
jgi:hypothetical protein